MKTRFYQWVVLVLTFVLFNALACNLPINPVEDAADLPVPAFTLQEPVQVQTGDPVPLASTNIPPAGGIIQVTGTGTLLDGFSVSVSPDTYQKAVSFSISYLPIESHNLSPELIPITPLIQVDNGGALTTNFLEITLPCQLSPDQFAMLFILNREKGRLEPLPLLAQDSSHLVALTTHFSQLLGVAINKAELDALNIKTGFKHGVHNWPFDNFQTDLLPSGFCFGNVTTALDYFLRHEGLRLYDVYDNYDNSLDPTPNQAYDDRLGVRFVSVVQDRLNMTDIGNNYWMKVQNKQDHSLTYYAIAMALKVSQEPQLLFMFPASGKAGHSVIVYEKYRDEFSISDPNRPKSGMSYLLIYDRSAAEFDSINRSPIGKKKNITFTRFYFMNKYDFIREPQMTSLWGDFLAGTIGKDEYPPTFLYLAKNYAAPEDRNSDIDFEITGNFLFIDKKDLSKRGSRARLFDASVAVAYVEVYDEKNKLVARSDDNIIVNVNKPAGNRYLFTFWGFADGWIDGRWITLQPSLTGNYHGGRCMESESEPYRWEVDITQDPYGYVTGVVKFHRCPGGGAVSYDVTGNQQPGKATVTLKGVKSTGRGDLGDASPYEVNFTFGLKRALSPNFAN